MFNWIKLHKVLSLLIVVNLVAILVVVSLAIYNSLKTATIDISVAPSEAVIELNGNRYDNFQSYDVIPGDYHVKISMEGMQTKEYDFALEKGGFMRIKTYLLDNEGGFSYYLTHPNDELALAEVADDNESKAFVREYNRVYKIVNELPILYDEYSDDFTEYSRYEIDMDEREDCGKIVCLVILDSTGGNEQRAKDKLTEMGYDINDYDIRYKYEPNQSVRVGGDDE